MSVKNIQISQGRQDLTAQAGLIHVVKFFNETRFCIKDKADTGSSTWCHWSLRHGVHDSVAPGRNYWRRMFDKFDVFGLDRAS